LDRVERTGRRRTNECLRTATPTTARSTFAAFHVRNFRLFFTGQLVSQVGNWLTSIALVLLVLHRTGSGLAVGLLTACQFGPILLLGAWTGLIADRSDKRRLLLATQSLEMLQSLALGALAFAHGAPLWAFYVTASAGGLMLAFDMPARRAFVAELVPAEQVHNAVTLNSALMTGSRVVGPALAGLLVTTAGFGWAFTIDALSYLAVLVCLWRMRPGELRRPPAARRARGQVRAGLRYVRAVPDLWIPLVIMAVVGTLTFNFSVVVPLFVERTLGGTDATYTLLFSVLSLGSLAGALAATHRRSVGIRTIAGTSAGFGAMFLLAASPNLATAFPAALVLGVASVSFMTLSTALVQVRADPRMRGRVIAIQSMVIMGSTPIGGPLLGAISDAFGGRAGLAVGGLAAAGAAIWGFRAGHRLATTEAVATGAEEPHAELFEEASGINTV
jgi:MFS family permease